MNETKEHGIKKEEQAQSNPKVKRMKLSKVKLSPSMGIRNLMFYSRLNKTSEMVETLRKKRDGVNDMRMGLFNIYYKLQKIIIEEERKIKILEKKKELIKEGSKYVKEQQSAEEVTKEDIERVEKDVEDINKLSSLLQQYRSEQLEFERLYSSYVATEQTGKTEKKSRKVKTNKMTDYNNLVVAYYKLMRAELAFSTEMLKIGVEVVPVLAVEGKRKNSDGAVIYYSNETRINENDIKEWTNAINMSLSSSKKALEQKKKKKEEQDINSQTLEAILDSLIKGTDLEDDIEEELKEELGDGKKEGKDVSADIKKKLKEELGNRKKARKAKKDLSSAIKKKKDRVAYFKGLMKKWQRQIKEEYKKYELFHELLQVAEELGFKPRYDEQYGHFELDRTAMNSFLNEFNQSANKDDWKRLNRILDEYRIYSRGSNVQNPKIDNTNILENETMSMAEFGTIALLVDEGSRVRINPKYTGENGQNKYRRKIISPIRWIKNQARIVDYSFKASESKKMHKTNLGSDYSANKERTKEFKRILRKDSSYINDIAGIIAENAMNLDFIAEYYEKIDFSFEGHSLKKRIIQAKISKAMNEWYPNWKITNSQTLDGLTEDEYKRRIQNDFIRYLNKEEIETAKDFEKHLYNIDVQNKRRSYVGPIVIKR